MAGVPAPSPEKSLAAPPADMAGVPAPSPEKSLAAPPADMAGVPAPTAQPSAKETLPPPVATEQTPPKVEQSISGKTGNKNETKVISAGTPAAKKPEKPLLSAVTFTQNTIKGEMIFFKLNGFFPPKVIGSETGNPKVICNFSAIDLGSDVKEVIPCNGKFVTSIQITRQKKARTVKAVLNLTPNRNYDLQQVFYKEDNLFVIVINSQDSQEKPSL